MLIYNTNVRSILGLYHIKGFHLNYCWNASNNNWITSK